MAKNLLNKYVWLVETIYKARKISFEDINRRWLDNDMSEGIELSKRTFHKWRIEVEEMFGLIIENENKGQYRFYIQNADELKNGTLRSWLASRRAFPQLPNHQLHTVSEYCGYHLANHHHALADAEACAWIAREIL